MTIETSTSLEEIEYLDVLSDSATLLTAAGSDELSEIMRWLFGTGILGIRQYTSNEAYTRERNFAGYSALNIHDHSNLRAVSGMAELAAIVNGRYVRTRHNDYSQRQSVQGAFLERELITPPEIPTSVLAKPTGLATDGTLDLVGDTQAKWMSEITPDMLRADLSFLEVWLEVVPEGGNVEDAAISERHADFASGLLEQYELNTLTSVTGVKDTFENLANRPFLSVPYSDPVTGKIVHRTCVLNYRINTVPVGNMGPTGISNQVPTILIGTQNSHDHTLNTQLTQQQYDDLRSSAVASVDLTSTDVGHTHIYTITWDVASSALSGIDTNVSHQHTVFIQQGFDGALPFNEAKAKDNIIDSTNRFKLIRDARRLKSHSNDLDALQSSRSAHYECVDLERLMESCWGMEGRDSVIKESYTLNNTLIEFDDVDDPGTPGHPTLNSALYNRQANLNRADASGRQRQHRGFNDPSLFVALTNHPEVAGGASWALPLEILVRSPLENWNPAGINLDLTEPKPQVLGSGTEIDPYQNANTDPFYYFTPAAAYSAIGLPMDPADTAASTRWMRGSDGNAYECFASGTWVFNPDGSRGRIPIYYDAYNGNKAAVTTRLLKQNLKALIQKMEAGTPLVASDYYFLED